MAFVVKNQENLIPKFPSQAVKARTITVILTVIVELKRLTNLKSGFLVCVRLRVTIVAAKVFCCHSN
ncbi:MAG: hypothetical protein EWV76_14600 [Microcystis novacekii Mn_MB_F_20050700_S1]|uniref:Uncharacterized protein n=1 Tax=Microcystis novacekii Mn_MB_F_20050700_S1D TaxID=2486266 RepID=A0A552J319_9CHRO|nr:MAG: hypothetical protein EWV76_14600 [Microcystis novacekii Mn_MB_F_20050700_S1]TRU90072.1 MAG: hypothetical protein EWV54_07435 [Microcystis novacekii Mn_MB_F_20050700_S1D]